MNSTFKRDYPHLFPDRIAQLSAMSTQALTTQLEHIQVYIEEAALIKRLLDVRASMAQLQRLVGKGSGPTTARLLTRPTQRSVAASRW